jgi:hypothetical protein
VRVDLEVAGAGRTGGDYSRVKAKAISICRPSRTYVHLWEDADHDGEEAGDPQHDDARRVGAATPAVPTHHRQVEHEHLQVDKPSIGLSSVFEPLPQTNLST